jgi:hypothetical protein
VKPTVTYLVRHFSDQCPAPRRRPTLMVDLPVAVVPLKSLPPGIGEAMHDAFHDTVRQQPSGAYSEYVQTLLTWLTPKGCTRVRSEWRFLRGRMRARCDVWVSGGLNQHGVIEIKTCSTEDLPVLYPRREEEHQLGLYARAAQPIPASSIWGAVVYVCPTQSMLRVFAWAELDEHARAAGRLLQAA